MISAIDTSILIDLIQKEEKAIQLLANAAQEGKLIICEIVYSELCAGMTQQMIDQFLKDYIIEFFPTDKKALALAGQLWREHILNQGRGGHVIADFLIGAHAKIHADRLLSSDRGFYRRYFKEFVVVGY